MTNYFNGYNNYPQYPQGYQSNMQRQGQMFNSQMPQPQPMPMQPQYQMQQPQPQQSMQPVEMPFNYFGYGNYKEVESHILFPNQKALFIDKANNMFYEKTCNNDGISVISQYKRVEDKAENQAVEPQKQEPTIDLSSYVKKEDLGAFVGLEEYKQLLGKVEQLQKQIMGVKTNVGTTKQ
jgi:hypothetical protein